MPEAKSLACRVPQTRRSGNPQTDLLRSQERDAFKEVIQLLEEHPQHRGTTRDFLKKLVADEQASSAIVSEGLFKEAVTTMAKIPEDWMASWLTSRSKLSLTDLGRIKAFDGASICQMFLYALNASGQTRLPPECQSKEVLWRACEKRAVAVGNRITDLKYQDPFISSDGKLNWSLLGEYTMIVEGGVVKELTHKSTAHRAAVSGDGFAVGADFEVRDNLISAVKAVLTKGARKYACADFFAKDKGPHAARMLVGSSVAFNALVQDAVVEKQAAESTAKTATAPRDLSDYQAPLVEKQKEATKRAREALKARREEHAKKRKVTVQDGVVVVADK